MKSKISRIPKPYDRSGIERQELAEAILRELPRDGSVEVKPGLTLFRVSAPTEPVYGVSESCFCVIAQGAKHVMLGEDRLRYDPNHYLISTVGLPIISHIDVASSVNKLAKRVMKCGKVHQTASEGSNRPR